MACKFTEEKLDLEKYAGHLDHHFQCPTLLVEMKTSLKETSRNQALNSGEKMNTFSHSESPHSKETNNITNPSC
jgi:hypothetical protein